MLMNPDAQTKAQEEIDRVIGTDRLPTFDDEPNLPYVSAFSKEVFRWQQAAPFGMRAYFLCINFHVIDYILPCFPAIPHRLMEDDVYNGYFLPKDSIVLGNAWCALPFSIRAPPNTCTAALRMTV
jgi:cytochrome P450